MTPEDDKKDTHIHLKIAKKLRTKKRKRKGAV